MAAYACEEAGDAYLQLRPQPPSSHNGISSALDSSETVPMVSEARSQVDHGPSTTPLLGVFNSPGGAIRAENGLHTLAAVTATSTEELAEVGESTYEVTVTPRHRRIARHTSPNPAGRPA